MRIYIKLELIMNKNAEKRASFKLQMVDNTRNT